MKFLQYKNLLKEFALKISTRILSYYLRRQKQALAKEDISIICNNCVGGVLLKDLSLKFNSPTINLYFFAEDYIRFLENLENYIKIKPKFSSISTHFPTAVGYPIGKIEDVEIHFLHYGSIEEAEEKWNQRSKRILWDNLYIIGSDRDGGNEMNLIRFLEIPFKNKVYFSSRPSGAKEVVYFPEYKTCSQVGDLIKDDYAWYFHFDTVHWINTGLIRKSKLITRTFLLNRKLKL